MPFDGATYDRKSDCARLTGQMLRVWQVMQDGKWRTLSAIEHETAKLRADFNLDSQAAISARLRDFRKIKFGAHAVERERVEGGLFRYRLLIRKTIQLSGQLRFGESP